MMRKVPWPKNPPKLTSALKLTQPPVLRLPAAGAPAPSAGPFKGEQPKGDPAPAGGVEVEMISDYWPAEQPEPEQDPKKLIRENRLRAGERVTLPQEEVMTLLERGIARRVQK
jgi:hypothetical protein